MVKARHSSKQGVIIYLFHNNKKRKFPALINKKLLLIKLEPGRDFRGPGAKDKDEVSCEQSEQKQRALTAGLSVRGSLKTETLG